MELLGLGPLGLILHEDILSYTSHLMSWKKGGSLLLFPHFNYKIVVEWNFSVAITMSLTKPAYMIYMICYAGLQMKENQPKIKYFCFCFLGG